MKRRAITCTAALLTLGLWSMTALSQNNDEKKAAQEAVLKLVDSMKNGKGDVKGQIEAIAKKFDELEPIMWVYKPRKKGGIGMGEGGADDIEITIGKMGGPKFKMDPKKLAKMKDDLIKAGELSKAVAEIAGQDKYAKQYAKKDAAKWKGYIKDMKKGAEDLIAAAKSGNAAKVKKAATDLSNSCTSCHSDFRD
jgi:hypothetical protein